MPGSMSCMSSPSAALDASRSCETQDQDQHRAVTRPVTFVGVILKDPSLPGSCTVSKTCPFGPLLFSAARSHSESARDCSDALLCRDWHCQGWQLVAHPENKTKRNEKGRERQGREEEKHKCRDPVPWTQILLPSPSLQAVLPVAGPRCEWDVCHGLGLSAQTFCWHCCVAGIQPQTTTTE